MRILWTMSVENDKIVQQLFQLTPSCIIFENRIKVLAVKFQIVILIVTV